MFCILQSVNGVELCVDQFCDLQINISSTGCPPTFQVTPHRASWHQTLFYKRTHPDQLTWCTASPFLRHIKGLKLCVNVYFIKPSWAAGKWAFWGYLQIPGTDGRPGMPELPRWGKWLYSHKPAPKSESDYSDFQSESESKRVYKKWLYLDSDLCPPHHYFIFDARNNRLQTIYFCFTLPSPYFSFLPFHWPSLQKDDSDYQEAKTPNNKNNVFLLKKLHYKCRPDCIICSHKLGFG